MNLDKAIDAIEAGFADPHTIIQKVTIPADDAPKYGLRRKGSDPQLSVWSVAVGERGAPPHATFIHYKVNTALKKALAWRGVQPNKRVRGNKNGAQPAAQAG